MFAFRKLFGRKPKAAVQPPVEPPAAAEALSGPTLNMWYTYGRHRYYSAGEPVEVVFTNARKGILRVIVDDRGMIRDFPGIEDLEKIAPMIENGSMEPKVRFRTDFQRCENGIMMLWQIQPDGRYWEDDDGFGMEHDMEIYLYSVLNEEGRFTAPFRLYRVNGKDCRT